MSHIRAAKEWGQRPSAVLMKDPYFGHRDWLTWEPEADKDEWTDQDYLLVTVVQIIQDHTNKHGLLDWEVKSERMDVNAIKQIDKFQAAVDRATRGTKKKGYTPSPGEYFEAKLDLRGGEWPTYTEYMEGLLAEK